MGSTINTRIVTSHLKLIAVVVSKSLSQWGLLGWLWPGVESLCHSGDY